MMFQLLRNQHVSMRESGRGLSLPGKPSSKQWKQFFDCNIVILHFTIIVIQEVGAKGDIKPGLVMR